MGVRVKETAAEMMMVTPRVTANSRNNRPTTSPMNKRGMSTAMSETVRDRMVKPICLEPLRAASQGIISFLDEPGDIFDHDNGVIDDKAGGNGQGHQGEVVQTKSQKIHDPKGTHQGKGDGHAGNRRGRQVAQEDKDDQDDQGHGQHQLELHIPDRGANGRGPVGQDRDLDGRRQGTLQFGHQFFDPVDHFDDIGPRLALDI